MALQIRKATRKKAKLRLALLGPTGSGKTMGALKLAFGIGGKIGVVDTENGSADLYADLGDYDVIALEKPYTVLKYREAISAFERAGYDTIIVDSLSHAWSGSGGLLDKQGQLESSGRAKNSFAAWREITPEHNALVETLLSSPAHIIATMRVKTEYVLETNEKGKQVPRKVGMAPVQRDGVEYEFTVVMDVDAGHKATASKDRTTLFEGWTDTLTEDTGRKLREWLDAGSEPAPREDRSAGFPLQAPRAPDGPAPGSDDVLPLKGPGPDGKLHAIVGAELWKRSALKAVALIGERGKLDDWLGGNEPLFASVAERHPDEVHAVRKAVAERFTELFVAEPEAQAT